MDDLYCHAMVFMKMVHSQAAPLYNYMLLFTALSQQNCREQAAEMIHSHGPVTEEKCKSVCETERKNPGGC